MDKKLSRAVGFKGICKKVLILMLVGQRKAPVKKPGTAGEANFDGPALRSYDVDAPAPAPADVEFEEGAVPPEAEKENKE